MTYGKTETTAG